MSDDAEDGPFGVPKLLVTAKAAAGLLSISVSSGSNGHALQRHG